MFSYLHYWCSSFKSNPGGLEGGTILPVLLFAPHDWQKPFSCWSDISNNVAKISKKNCLAPQLQGWLFHPVSVFYVGSHSGEYYLIAEGHSEKQGVRAKYHKTVHICLYPWDRNPDEQAKGWSKQSLSLPSYVHLLINIQRSSSPKAVNLK